MVTPLTPIGFDLPQTTRVAVQAPNQSLPQPDTTGLQVLAQAGQQTQQTMQNYSQSVQLQAKATADIAQSMSQSVQATSQAAAQASQIKASNSQVNAQLIANIGDSVLKYSSRYAETMAAKDDSRAKELAAAQKAAAITDLENLRVDWIEGGKIDSEGTAAYRDAVATTLSKYQVPTEAVGELTQRYFDPAIDYAKRTEGNRQQAAEEITKQQRRINVEGFKGKLSASLGGLRASVGLDSSVVDSHYANIKASTEELLSNQTVPIIDRLTAVADGLEMTNAVMKDRNVDASRLQADLAATQSVLQFANEQQQQLRAGAITYDEYNASIKLEAIRLNLPGFNVPDPNSAEKYQQDVLGTQDSIRELRQKQVINQLQSINADDDVVGALATQFILDPTAYQNVKATPDKLLDRNALAAKQVYEDFIKWRDSDTPQYNAEQSRFKADVNGKWSDFERWFANASRDPASASQDPRFNKQLEAVRAPMLGMGVDVDQLKGRPLTQETVTQMQTAYQREIDAVRERAATATQDYQNAAARFARYGLSLNVNDVKTANKAQQGRLQQYREQLAKLKASATDAISQPGNSPNFNGGAPGKPKNWKPLAKSSYGGKTITFPFPQSVVATLPGLTSGQMFGASRGGGTRSHQGLDFAVPIGTPALSLVYGTVINVTGNDDGTGIMVEVKGDDGLDYRYLHLSKPMVVEGERVGAGQTLALSGDTQGSRGESTGAHLHLDIFPTGQNTPIDPLSHLASRQFGDKSNQTRMPRTSGSSSNPSTPRTVLPPGAIPLGGSHYLVGGKVVKSDSPDFKRTVNYTPQSPVRNSYAGNGDSNPLANHGYKALADDKDFARELNAVAKRQGIPAQWLADLIAVESAGTFSTSIHNGLGYYGLIQFGSSARQDLGIDLDKLIRLSPAKQMAYVEKYLNLQKRYAGVDKFKSPVELIAAVNQGHTVLRDVRARGEAAIRDPENRDGAGVTLMNYVNMLGKYSGRQYESTRAKRVSSAVHTRPAPSCTMCSAMLASTQFAPHESQNV